MTGTGRGELWRSPILVDVANTGFTGNSEALVTNGTASHFTWPFTLNKADGGSETYFVNAHMTS